MEIKPFDNKPNLNKRLFWEFKFENIDWQREYASIIERAIERGSKYQR